MTRFELAISTVTGWQHTPICCMIGSGTQNRTEGRKFMRLTIYQLIVSRQISKELSKNKLVPASKKNLKNNRKTSSLLNQFFLHLILEQLVVIGLTISWRETFHRKKYRRYRSIDEYFK